jgi:hypothetical protein
MNDSGTPKPIPARYLRPTIVEWNDTDYPPLPITPVPVEERFRDIPTRLIEQHLLRGTMNPQARAAALAELARRGVEPPKSEGGNP